MDIDLSLLHSRTKEEIDITNTYKVPATYFKNTPVIDLGDVNVTGKVYLSHDETLLDEEVDYISCSITGTMTIEDSISLEPVSYPFQIEYDDILEENCKKDENTLDIFQFLWENIVLEIPLQFTKVKDLSKFHGDGWRLVSEDDLKKENNPFSDLLEK